jgi:hypothetical protein
MVPTLMSVAKLNNKQEVPAILNGGFLLPKNNFEIRKDVFLHGKRWIKF